MIIALSLVTLTLLVAIAAALVLSRPKTVIADATGSMMLVRAGAVSYTHLKHTMVIADSSSIHEPCPGQESAGYNLVGGGLDADDVINSWNIEQELRTGKYTLTDYNFKTPSASLLASEPTIVSVGGNAGFEIFDHPGEYATRGDGTTFAKLRMQEEEAGHLVAHGSSVCRAFTTGYKFDLADHYQDSMNTSYVLTEIQHIASVGGTYSGSSSGGSDSYSNHFTCIPETVPFRPARLTPKPFVQGPQTAVVIGKASYSDTSGDDGGGDGEEIWVCLLYTSRCV